MNGLLGLDPATRTSAAEALKHPWFTTEHPKPTPVGQMPQARNCAVLDLSFFCLTGKRHIGKIVIFYISFAVISPLSSFLLLLLLCASALVA